MPRDGSGVYSAPSGTLAVSTTLISSSAYNALVADLEANANEARPVSVGGTGQTSIVGIQTAFKIAPLDAAATITADWTFSGAIDFTGATVTGIDATPADGTITEAKLADDAVTNAKLAADAVDTEQLVDDAVENAQIAANAVDEAQIVDGAVTTAKIADSSISEAKLNFTPSGGYQLFSSTDIVGGSTTSAVTGLSGFKNVRIRAVARTNGTGQVFNFQARTSGGTWRTVYTTIGSTASNGALTGTLEITYFNNAETGMAGIKPMMAASSASSSAPVSTANSFNEITQSTEAAAVWGYSTEAWDEIRLTGNDNLSAPANLIIEAY